MLFIITTVLTFNLHTPHHSIEEIKNQQEIDIISTHRKGVRSQHSTFLVIVTTLRHFYSGFLLLLTALSSDNRCSVAVKC